MTDCAVVGVLAALENIRNFKHSPADEQTAGNRKNTSHAFNRIDKLARISRSGSLPLPASGIHVTQGMCQKHTKEPAFNITR